MNQFKMVVESFQSDLKKIVENMNYRFDKIEQDSSSMKEQIALLLEGQTEIKAELRSGLKDKVSRQEFKELETRMENVEKKVA